MKNLKGARERMVITQLQARGIRDSRVIAAFCKVPREHFVLPEHKDESYNDYPLPIGNGQTISQPYMVALMTESLALRQDERVLEIGTGSGYQTAILAELCKEVYTVERVASLSETAQKRLTSLGYSNIWLKTGDGSCGWPEYAPYNAIIVTCAAPELPPPLLEQLSDGGRSVIPIGGNFSQMLTVFEKRDSEINERSACGCVFVPLVGKYGLTDK